jgi:hypothetical protein
LGGVVAFGEAEARETVNPRFGQIARASTPAVDRDLAACRSRTQGGHRMIILGCDDVRGSSGDRGPQRSGSAMAGDAG